MVNTLVQIVGGSSASTAGSHGVLAQARPKITARAETHAAPNLHAHATLHGNGNFRKPARKTAMTHQGGFAVALEDQRSRPEEVIPLDDKELAEF
jgi:hypothetical protein